MTDKQVPFDEEAEQAVLGSILISGDCMPAVSVAVKTDDFFSDQHGAVYQACLNLYERSAAINLITVADELGERLDAVGGPSYLSSLVSMVPTSLHAEHYASIVQRASLSRKLIQTAGKIAQLGYENKQGVDEVFAECENLLYGLRQNQVVAGFQPMSRLVEMYLEEDTARQSKSVKLRGERIPTGLTALDHILGGLHRSDLCIVAGRPSLGKSALLLNIAENAAKQGAKVGLFSLEMSNDQLVQRLLASNAGVELNRLRLGEVSDSERNRIFESAGQLSELTIWVDDSAGLRVSEIRSKAKRLAAQYGLDLVVVDYLGLAHGVSKNVNRDQEIGEVTRGLKGLAKEMQIPVLLAAQLNRLSEGRSDHRPVLSDLRESGNIEQDADVVMMIYREDKVTSEDDWMRNNPGKPYPKGLAEIIIAKHRNGPTDTARLMFVEQHTQFRDIDWQHEEGAGWWQDK